MGKSADISPFPGNFLAEQLPSDRIGALFNKS